MRDYLVLGALVLAFATLVTVHVALSARLALRTRPRWRGLVAFVVPPLAVIWGYKAGFRRSAVLWLAAVAVYAVARIAALA